MRELTPSASDRIVNAYAAARQEMEALYPDVPPLQRERTDAWTKSLHASLCAAIDRAYADGIMIGRRTRAKPRGATTGNANWLSNTALAGDAPNTPR